MSIDVNKKDFETALGEMKNYIEDLGNVLDQDIMNTLNTVVAEYEVHLMPDIQELIDDNERMKDELDGVE